MSETIYTFRTPYPDVLQRGRARVVSLMATRAGEVIAPVSGSFSLIDPTGAAVIDAAVVAVIDSVATYSISALELPESLDLSELYQQRWALTFADGVTRTARRECAVARFELYPPAGEFDLVLGEYPNLRDEISDIERTLQPFLDEAWAQILEALWASGRFPSLMLSTSALRQPLRQLSLYLVFKHLFRNTAGAGPNRWQVLMDRHRSDWEKSWATMTARIDHNHDGIADSRSRESASTVVHRNAHRSRRLVRSNKW